MNGGRRGDWIQTFSGIAFWPLDPRPDEVRIEDIAHSLSLLCRYGGHCVRFYSVAEHSVHVSRLVPQEHALAGLLHDATEAYVIDVPRPLKGMLAGYAAIEAASWKAIATRFCLPELLPACVKKADTEILLAERDELMSDSPMPWGVEGDKPEVAFGFWSPAWAELLFLQRFRELT